jgi:hypothetical protein
MKHQRGGALKKIGREIREEAARQLRGFPAEAHAQLTRGWGKEFARQIFGNPERDRRRGRR